MDFKCGYEYQNAFHMQMDHGIQMPYGDGVSTDQSDLNIAMLSTLHTRPTSAFHPRKDHITWSDGLPVGGSHHTKQMGEFGEFDYVSLLQPSQVGTSAAPSFAEPFRLRDDGCLNSLFNDAYAGSHQLNSPVRKEKKGLSQNKPYTRISPHRNPIQREIHILAERQRREEMNEKFALLKSIVPKLTKRDKASIITEAIKYVMELEQKLKGLNAVKAIRQKECNKAGNRRSSSVFSEKVESPVENMFVDTQVHDNQHIETFSKQFGRGNKDGGSSQIEVQDLGCQAIIKILCPWKSGLVMRTHKALDDCRVDVVQSSMSTIGGKVVHYLTININGGMSSSIDKLISTLEESLTYEENHSIHEK